MSYANSTRGSGPVSFAETLRRGLAPDGGLYLPRILEPSDGGPPADAAGELAVTASALARTLLGREAGPWLDTVISDALDFPLPLTQLDEGLHLLELHHGPTLAFKDVGARFLARAMAALDTGSARRTVLVATSGDTGGAVAAAFHGLERYRVVALFPRDGITERQRRQMTTLGGNVTALAVEGTFDDCQRLTKRAFADPELAEELRLTSANSINLGRLLPQAFYYGHAAACVPYDDAPTWVVPSGNLGNLCAGVLAARVGVPAAGFVAALNRNRVFLDYLEGGSWEPGRSLSTPSTAMDVGDPSNLERLRALFDDDARVMARQISAASISDEETHHTMQRIHKEFGLLIDPHTAVGLAAWDAVGRPRPAVVLSTAHPAKFPEEVRRATGCEPPLPDRLARLSARAEHATVVPTDYDIVRRHLREDPR